MIKVAIITGTRKGIGKYLASYYLSKGFIVAGCSRGKGTIENRNYVHYLLDVSSEKLVIDAVKDVNKRFGKIDILINNAGIASMNHLILTPTKTVIEIFQTNFFGAFNFTREVAKVMIKKSWGRIVNISTVAVPLALEGESAYTASKAALEQFSKVAAKELSSFNITVNAIGVAPAPTDLIKTLPKQKLENLLNRMAIKRYAKMQDISNLIDFYIKEESNYITGQTVYLGGL